ncbi:MAG: hypothetical protein E7598_00420 [Ruminococcaceae bacterium]|nr:hypothetical protein [Oscillospiraceae bacterium]
MRLSLREKPVLKSVVYTLVCLGILLFSYSFLPAIRIFANTPTLLVAVVSSLAFFEGAKYASFFALIFSVIETVVIGTNTLIFPLFYTVFAIVCTWLFESFFVRNYFAWLCYTLGGLLIHAILSLFAPVSNWEIGAGAIVLENTLPSFAMSAVLSLLIYPIFKSLKVKTDK